MEGLTFPRVRIPEHPALRRCESRAGMRASALRSRAALARASLVLGLAPLSSLASRSVAEHQRNAHHDICRAAKCPEYVVRYTPRVALCAPTCRSLSSSTIRLISAAPFRAGVPAMAGRRAIWDYRRKSAPVRRRKLARSMPLSEHRRRPRRGRGCPASLALLSWK
jgi:hypothetical protein